MKSLKMFLAAALLLATSLPVMAQNERIPGDMQRYGGHWRYQHRDWSGVYGRANPGVCWQWNSEDGEWDWTC